ncbi:hypothetical protein M0802_005453 [Mischocyttarus mexicanus]|nr:hypothetical protein M0802_005453 [Mischocyttarus mexicanus]
MKEEEEEEEEEEAEAEAEVNILTVFYDGLLWSLYHSIEQMIHREEEEEEEALKKSHTVGCVSEIEWREETMRAKQEKQRPRREEKRREKRERKRDHKCFPCLLRRRYISSRRKKLNVAVKADGNADCDPCNRSLSPRG